MSEENQKGLPTGWTWATLGDIGRYLNGRGFKKTEWSKSGRLIIRIQDLTGTGSKPNFFEGHADPENEVTHGDLLVSWAATLGAYIWRGPDAVLNQHIFKVDSYIDRTFHFYLLQSVLADLQRQAHGTGMVHITKSKFDNTPVALPPLGEQQRITAEIEKQFTRLDAAVGTLKRAQKNLKSYRASLLRAAFEGRLVSNEAELARDEGREYEHAETLIARTVRGLRTSKAARAIDRKSEFCEESQNATQTNLPALPQGWNWATLGQLFHIAVGSTPSRAQADYWHGDVPWVSSGEVAFRRIRQTREQITRRGLSESSTELHPPGTVLLAMIGEGRTRGQAAILDIEACNNQNSAAIRVSGTSILPEFVYYFLQSEYEKTRRLGSGNNQPALNKSRVQAIRLPVAPVSEQKRIVLELERRLSVMERLAASIAANIIRAQSLRNAVLKTAFAGQLVPQSLDDEPASALLERIRQERAAQSGTKSRRGRASKGAPQESRPSRAVESVGSPPGAHAPGSSLPPLRGSDSKRELVDEGAAGGPEFAALSRSEQIDAVWEALLGHGAIEKDEAVRVAAEGLRAKGMVRFQRLRRDGHLYEAIQKALEAGVRVGSFDRPARGQVRAVLPDPRDYTPETWQQCLLGVLDHQSMDQNEALRGAAEWARQNLGLEFARLREDGIILGGLREALKEALRRRVLVKDRQGFIQRTGE